MNTTFREFTLSDFYVICEMMTCLYQEDPGTITMTKKKAYNTLDFLFNTPHQGTVLVVESGNSIIGYALLINFWSNEYGGNVVNIDELFISKEYRSQGIASNLIKFLAKSKFANAVNIQLEVTPDNIKARRLYERLGFKLHKNTTYKMGLNI